MPSSSAPVPRGRRGCCPTPSRRPSSAIAPGSRRTSSMTRDASCSRSTRSSCARREWEHWSTERDDDTRQIMDDSVTPVLDAGLATLVDMDHRVSDEIWLEPTPGHTPGHTSVRLCSGGRDAVITGDLMHHPIQMAEPQWCSHFDVDPESARKTRRVFCERYA